MKLRYWIYKFSRNEDVSVIEYKTFDSEDEIVHPELTICFENPFLNDKLRKFGEDLEKEKYLDYLRGNIVTNETFMKFRYDEITFDLFDHFDKAFITSKSGSNLTKPNVDMNAKYECTNITNCNYFKFTNNYDGFDPMTSGFLRCFGIEINRKYVNDFVAIGVNFKISLKNILKQIGIGYIFFKCLKDWK